MSDSAPPRSNLPPFPMPPTPTHSDTSQAPMPCAPSPSIGPVTPPSQTPFPSPPKTNRQMLPNEVPYRDAPMQPPVIPAVKVPHFDTPHGPQVDTLISDDEAAFIFRNTLRPEQAEDPNILKFIMAYLHCRNTSQAARECGLTPAQGRTLRLKPEIHACIQTLTEKSVMKYGYDASEVIERVKEIAALDPLEFENPDGSFKTHMSQIAPESRRAIKKFKAKNIYGKDPNGMNIVIGQLIEVEMWDKLKSLELLGREKNIMKETKKVEHDVTQNMANVLLESQRLADTRSIIDVTPRISGGTPQVTPQALTGVYESEETDEES